MGLDFAEREDCSHWFKKLALACACAHCLHQPDSWKQGGFRAIYQASHSLGLLSVGKLIIFYSNIYTRRVLASKFQVVCPCFLRELVDLGLWDDNMKNMIIAHNGSVQNIPTIPQDVKAIYKTVREISQKKVLDLVADRGAFICQSQSLKRASASTNSRPAGQHTPLRLEDGHVLLEDEACCSVHRRSELVEGG